MAEHVLEMKLRKKIGKEAARKVRQQGYIPAVLYGYKGNKILSVKANEFERIWAEIGEHSIINLDIEGKERMEVIVKDFQLDPVDKHIIHIDFLEFEKGKVLRTEIPVHVVGTSVGVKKGGILETFVRDIEIECLPKDIPDSVEVDVTELEVGDSVHARDLVLDEKIKILTNPDQVILAIGTPTKIEVPVEEEEVAAVEGEAPAEEAAEPEAEPETETGADTEKKES
jgi:large subunit ribosomal protein L25